MIINKKGKGQIILLFMNDIINKKLKKNVMFIEHLVGDQKFF